jgi:hypothetical protein
MALMYRLVEGAGVIAACRCWVLQSTNELPSFPATSATDVWRTLEHGSTDPRASEWQEAAVKALVSGRTAGSNKQLIK